MYGGRKDLKRLGGTIDKMQHKAHARQDKRRIKRDITINAQNMYKLLRVVMYAINENKTIPSRKAIRISGGNYRMIGMGKGRRRGRL